ncbi:MAG: HD domain-containing protein [Balneolaceae bacterium]|nr:HD domain-containing protein [Balneolaceae bacterium]
MSTQKLEAQCRRFLVSDVKNMDAAHDLAHIERVVENAKLILADEKADEEITLAAAWLHDCVIIPKNDPYRRQASELAAKKASSFLKEIGFDSDKIVRTAHAIHAHSFSAGIRPETPEAEIVQDADRLDALGAVGIARCFTVGGKLERMMYEKVDPFCINREPDDSTFTLDHFYAKLFKLPDMMNTKTGAYLARERVQYMKQFLERFGDEIQGKAEE